MHLPASTNECKEARSPLEFWSALFSEDIIAIVVRYTNMEIRNRMATKELVPSPYYKETDVFEMRAFLGLIYYSGANKDHDVKMERLWDKHFSSPLYSCAFSLRRFQFLLARLRFDDKSTRSRRKAEDGLAPIREIWDIFIMNCRNNYTPSDFLTIDEQLLGFRGRFKGRVYIKNKPAKYGIKIVSINDAKTAYMLDAIPYTGKVITEANEQVPSYYIRKLCESISGSNRCVTVDNWFTSVPIFTKMLNEHSITMVGTVRKNKPQIPPVFKTNAAAGTVRHGHDGNNLLISYAPKKNKVVLLLSSHHKNYSISEDNGKPSIVNFYNENKGGTDSFDHLVSSYTCARKTYRWPMRFFMGMLDQAQVNAAILHNLEGDIEPLSHRDFLQELVISLIKPYVLRRLMDKQLPRWIRIQIHAIFDVPAAEIQPEEQENVGEKKKKKRCELCPRGKDIKSYISCCQCKKSVCDRHRKILCTNCFANIL